MENLPLHIEYLLTRHDCVIVPGLGAFIATETEACIDRERAIISPRRREISFNGSVIADDGLLSHSLARRERLSYEDAHRVLVQLIARMRRELELEEETSIGKIGKLTMTSDGTLRFIPRLPIADKDILTDLTLRATASDDSNPETGGENMPSHEEESDSISEGKGRRIFTADSDRYIFSISKRVVHAAAAVAIMLTVCLSLLIPCNHDHEQRASVVPIESFIRAPRSMENSDDYMDKHPETATDSVVNLQETKNL